MQIASAQWLLEWLLALWFTHAGSDRLLELCLRRVSRGFAPETRCLDCRTNASRSAIHYRIYRSVNTCAQPESQTHLPRSVRFSFLALPVVGRESRRRSYRKVRPTGFRLVKRGWDNGRTTELHAGRNPLEWKMNDEELIARYRAGETLNAIAEAMGCQLHTIVNRVTRLRDVLPYRREPLSKSHPRRRLAAARKEVALKLHKAGLSPQQIATKLKIDPQRVYKLLSQELPKRYEGEISRIESLLAEMS